MVVYAISVFDWLRRRTGQEYVRVDSHSSLKYTYTHLQIDREAGV